MIKKMTILILSLICFISCGAEVYFDMNDNIFHIDGKEIDINNSQEFKKLFLTYIFQQERKTQISKQRNVHLSNKNTVVIQDFLEKIEKQLNKSDKKNQNIVIGGKKTLINSEFTLDNYKNCNTILLAKFENNNHFLTVKEILKNDTNEIKIGNLIFSFSYSANSGISQPEAIFCRKSESDYINFINKDRLVFSKLKVEQIKKMIIQSSFQKDGTKIIKNKNVKFSKIKTPYDVNMDFSEDDLETCEVVLVTEFRKNNTKSLFVKNIIRDTFQTIKVGDELENVLLLIDSSHPKYLGAMYCYRDNKNFVNFYEKNGLIIPTEISIRDIIINENYLY